MPILTNTRLVYWSHDGPNDDGIDVSITDAKAYLANSGLKPERAEGIPESTAFRRGIAKVTGKIPETERVLFARIWTRKTDSVLTAKVFEQQEDEHGHLHAIDHAEYELTEQSGARQLSGQTEEYQRVRAAYRHAIDHYNASDCTKIIQKVLTEDGLGAYPCKPNGGVYFVPLRPGVEDMLDKLTQFCLDCGTRFLTYDIPDVSAQREEIAAAVFNSLTADLDLHNAAITAYTSDAKLGVLTNRREAIAATAKLIGDLTTLLNGKAVQLNGRIAELITMLDAKEQAVEAAAQTKRAQGPSRRIVTTTPVATQAIETPEATVQQPPSLFQ